VILKLFKKLSNQKLDSLFSIIKLYSLELPLSGTRQGMKIRSREVESNQYLKIQSMPAYLILNLFTFNASTTISSV